jgi:hypothetical protein
MIKLQLSTEQAYYLYAILRHVGGNPEGPRGQIADVLNTLETHKGSFEDLDVKDPEVVGFIVIDK